MEDPGKAVSCPPANRGSRGSGTQKRRVYMVDGFAFDSVNYRATTERGVSFAGVPHGIGDFIEVNRVFLA